MPFKMKFAGAAFLAVMGAGAMGNKTDTALTVACTAEGPKTIVPASLCPIFVRALGKADISADILIAAQGTRPDIELVITHYTANTIAARIKHAATSGPERMRARKDAPLDEPAIAQFFAALVSVTPGLKSP